MGRKTSCSAKLKMLMGSWISTLVSSTKSLRLSAGVAARPRRLECLDSRTSDSATAGAVWGFTAVAAFLTRGFFTAGFAGVFAVDLGAAVSCAVTVFSTVFVVSAGAAFTVFLVVRRGFEAVSGACDGLAAALGAAFPAGLVRSASGP